LGLHVLIIMSLATIGGVLGSRSLSLLCDLKDHLELFPNDQAALSQKPVPLRTLSDLSQTKVNLMLGYLLSTQTTVSSAFLSAFSLRS